MKHFRNFAEALCAAWHFPQPSTPAGPGAEWRGEERTAHTMDKIPSLCRHPTDEHWDRGGRRIMIRVDNQTVADLVNRHA
eukprot:3341592-Pyramimonas_sp.AAC.1